MAANQAQGQKQVNPAQRPSGPDDWHEEQLEQALKHLKLLHVKCVRLRRTIPQMLEPLSTIEASPEKMFAVFLQSIAAAATEINDFGVLYKSPESRKVLDQAARSREAKPKGIRPWRARDHPDWVDLDK